jgi:hypothetical protein
MDMGEKSNILIQVIREAEKLRKTKHPNFSGSPCMSNIRGKSYLGCLKLNSWKQKMKYVTICCQNYNRYGQKILQKYLSGTCPFQCSTGIFI